MIKYKNLYILGTSHISKQSIKEVKESILKLQPKIIAIELDQSRLQAMLSKKRPSKLLNIKSLGLKGFLFNSLGSFIERSLGKHTGIRPGSEIKTAIDLARKKKIKISLIDQPIHITIRKLTSQITRKEKLKFAGEILWSFLTKKELKFNLNKVPTQKIINKMITETKSKYPTVYKVLVEERNVYMAKNLLKLAKTYPDCNILAIVGAGHETGIVGELRSIKN